MAFITNINIEPFDALKNYNKYSVVYDSNASENYYVSRIDENFANSLNSTGFWSHFNNTGEWSFNSLWTPSYNFSVDSTVISKALQFGDSYFQEYQVGLSSQKHNFKVQFENIDNQEAKSLIAFFEFKHGSEPFLVKDPYFYEERLMVCTSWKHVFNQFKLNSINAIFEEYDKINA